MLAIGAGSSVVTRQVQQVQNAFHHLSETSVKLATLRRINSGKDDPAGLLAATELNRELKAIEEASQAAERNRSLVQVADSGLDQVGDLLNQIEGHRVAGAFERNSIDAAQRWFDDSAVNLSSSLHQIADADVAVESANLTRSIILTNTAVAAARLGIAAQQAQATLLDEVPSVGT